MDFVVAGVSGNVGSVVAETLLASKKSVRVVVRDAKKGEPWKAKGAEVVVADLNDAPALGAALAGAKGAFLLIPPNMASPTPRADQWKVGDALVEAVRESKIPHVVFLSSIAAQHEAGTGPITVVHRQELNFRKLSDTVFTFVRAAYFMENLGGSLGALGQGVLPTFNTPTLSFDMIATKDIGKTAAAALLEGPLDGKTSIIELTGPRKVSMNDVAEALSSLLHKPITVAAAPVTSAAQTLQGYGMQPEMAAAYQEMLAALESGHLAFEGGHRHATGTVDVREVLAALVSPKK